MLLCKDYYYTLKDFEELTTSLDPFNATDFKTVMDDFYGEASLTKLPFALTDSNVEKLWQMLVAEKVNDPIFKITKRFDEGEPSGSEVTNKFNNWIIKLLSIIAKTYDYYSTLLTNYATAQADLMSDIKATSKNNVKFNDTPQNSNVSGTYEGDDYITHFTHTEGETVSPLTTKMARLKEIQDSYKRTMADWLKEVGRVFLPEGD